jgi:hypothetical protein
VTTQSVSERQRRSLQAARITFQQGRGLSEDSALVHLQNLINRGHSISGHNRLGLVSTRAIDEVTFRWNRTKRLSTYYGAKKLCTAGRVAATVERQLTRTRRFGDARPRVSAQLKPIVNGSAVLRSDWPHRVVLLRRAA